RAIEIGQAARDRRLLADAGRITRTEVIEPEHVPPVGGERGRQIAKRAMGAEVLVPERVREDDGARARASAFRRVVDAEQLLGRRSKEERLHVVIPCQYWASVPACFAYFSAAENAARLTIDNTTAKPARVARSRADAASGAPSSSARRSDRRPYVSGTNTDTRSSHDGITVVG